MSSAVLGESRSNLLERTLQVREVIVRDPDELPAVRAGGIEHVEIVASRSLLAQIDLAVFPFRHSSRLPDIWSGEMPG